MTLTQFMDALREEGVIGAEYEERVAEFIERRQAEQGDSAAIVRRSGAGAIEQRPDPSMIPFPTSAQDRGIRTTRSSIPVDYGDESPAQAEDRWRRQEMEDPDGVLGLGGMTAGGIFGDAPIATDRYDPAARQRAAPAVAAQVQIKQLELLERMERRLEAQEQENKVLRAERDRKQLTGKKG
jgi:hypothetical protein